MSNWDEVVAIHREEMDMEDDEFHFLCDHPVDTGACNRECEPDAVCENCGCTFCDQHGDTNCRLNAGEYVSTCETCYYEYFQPAMVAYWRETGIRPRVVGR